jgi:hypothetical protein
MAWFDQCKLQLHVRLCLQLSVGTRRNEQGLSLLQGDGRSLHSDDATALLNLHQRISQRRMVWNLPAFTQGKQEGHHTIGIGEYSLGLLALDGVDQRPHTPDGDICFLSAQML